MVIIIYKTAKCNFYNLNSDKDKEGAFDLIYRNLFFRIFASLKSDMFGTIAF